METKNLSDCPVNWIAIYLCRDFSRDTLFHRFKSFIRFVFATVARSVNYWSVKRIERNRRYHFSHGKIIRALIRIAIRLYANCVTKRITDQACRLLFFPLFFHHSPSHLFCSSSASSLLLRSPPLSVNFHSRIPSFESKCKSISDTFLSLYVYIGSAPPCDRRHRVS